MVRRKLHPGLFCLDAGYVNARGECDAINQLEIWHANEVIELLFPEDAQREAEEGKNQRRTRKARSYWISYALDNTADERALVREIAETIFGGKPLSSGEKNDARIVFTAKKYSSILVTRDGASKTQPRGILGAAGDLAKIGVTVMSDVQAVEFIRSQIAQRDRAARCLAERFGTPLPVWVGMD